MATQTKKITLDTAALFFGKIVGLLIGIVRLNYLATYLGVANFGILNFSLYFVSLFSVLFDLGISQLLTRDLARDPSRSNEYVGKSIILKLVVVSAAGLLVGIIGIVSHFDHDTNWAILMTTAVFAINGLSLVFLGAFQAHRKMTIVSLYNIFNDLALSILVILLISNFPHVGTVLLLTIAVSFVNLILLSVIYRRQIGRPRFQIDTKLWRDLLRESTPIAISSLGISMYTFIGATILKYTRGNVEVGIYSAGYKIISIFTIIPVTFSQIVYPIFSDFFVNAKHKLVKALADSFRIIIILTVPLAVGTAILAPKIFSMLFPSEFLPGMIVLQLTIFGNIFGYLDWIMYTFLLAINRQNFSMAVSITVGIMTFIAGLIAIPHFGYISLPFIQISVEVSLFVIQWWYLARIKYSAFSPVYFVKPVFASLLMGITLFSLIRLNLFSLVAIGLVIYAGSMYFIKGFGDQERELWNKVLSIAMSGRNKDS